MNDTHDVVLLEQHGTRFSEPELTCPEVGPARLRAIGLGSYATKTRRSFVRAVGKCRARLLASGIDRSGYNTTENAADLADLRVAMGIPDWNVFGGSYGAPAARAARSSRRGSSPARVRRGRSTNESRRS